MTVPYTEVAVNSSSFDLQAHSGGEVPSGFINSLKNITTGTLGEGIKFKNRAGEDIVWTFVDSFYFAMEIVTTVGYGDIVPGNDAAKAFTIFFTLAGIIVVSGAIGTIANAFLEKQREMAKAAQRKILEQASQIGGACPQEDGTTSQKDEVKGNEDKQDDLVPAGNQKSLEPNNLLPAISNGIPPSKLGPSPLPQLSKSDSGEEDVAAGGAKEEDVAAVEKASSQPSVSMSNEGDSEIPVKVSKTKGIIDKGGVTATKFVVGAKVAIPIYIYIAACFVLGHMEDWSGVDSIYFSIITLTTVGFGDVTPQTQEGRILASFLLPIGLVTLTIVGSSMAEKLASVGKKGKKSLKTLLSELQHVIEEDDDGTVSEEEFMIFMLKQSGKLDEDTEDILRRQFKALDADGSGELDQEDVVMLGKMCDEMNLDDE